MTEHGQGQGRQDEYYNMDNRPGRTPSPGHPLAGYQMENTTSPAHPLAGYQADNSPYGRPAQSPGPNLEIPMGPGRQASSDRLQAQPTVSLFSLSNRSQLADRLVVLCHEHRQLLRTQRTVRERICCRSSPRCILQSTIPTLAA